MCIYMKLHLLLQVLEYLLWASMCMESSVPLLGVRYLTWRTTLYAAVCQCYYDCKVKHHAEVVKEIFTWIFIVFFYHLIDISDHL